MTGNGRGVCTLKADTHEYAIDGEPAISVTQAVEIGGLAAEYSPHPAAMANREYAGLRGRQGHIACDLIDQGVLDWDHLRAEAAPLIPIAESWQAFRESEPFTPTGPAPLDGVITYELRVWWKPLMVAGTLDRLGDWRGRPHIVDVKTEKTRTLPWQHGIQEAGYAVLWLLGEGVPLGEPLRKAFGDIGRTVVQLGRDRPARACICSGCRRKAGYHIVTYDDPEDLDTFVAALTIARAKKARMKSLPVVAELD